MPHARPVSAARTIALSPLAGAIAHRSLRRLSAGHVRHAIGRRLVLEHGPRAGRTRRAAGAAVLRARQLATAAGIADIGTLTALGHSASIFWAGSCVSLGTGNTATAATVNASLAADRLSPANALGSRAQFGVRSALADVGDTAGGHAPLPVATIRDPAGDDRTGSPPSSSPSRLSSAPRSAQSDRAARGSMRNVATATSPCRLRLPRR